jgi:hypothetical protein
MQYYCIYDWMVLALKIGWIGTQNSGSWIKIHSNIILTN